jgi:predicted ArsR family transcriptional regulator
MWREIKNIADPAVRRNLTRRVCDALVEKYGGEVHGATLDQRLLGLKRVFSERGIELEIDHSGQLPVIRERGCPYPDLAAEDRGICALEKQVFSRVLGSGVRLSQCRLDGAGCCEFEARQEPAKVAVS